MASQKETQNLNLTQATEFVEDFFGHNTPLVETFVTLYIYMLKQNSGFLIRTNGEILGVARMEEHYRFYVSKKEGECFIKFKHRSEKEPFTATEAKRYMGECDECNRFFELGELNVPPETVRESIETGKDIPAKGRKERIDGLIPLKKKAENCLRVEVNKNVQITARDTYNELLRLFGDFCVNGGILNVRDGDILMSRIMRILPVTLQQLGERYGFTRERIRQRQMKTWKRVAVGVQYDSKKEGFIRLREQLISILEGLPDEEYFSVMVLIRCRNEILGSWLQEVSIPFHVRLPYLEILQKLNQELKPSEDWNTPDAGQVRDGDHPSVFGFQDRSNSTETVHTSRYPCPFCGTVGALSIYAETKSYQCASCHAQGSMIPDAENSNENTIAPTAMTAQEPEPMDESIYRQLMRDAARYHHNQLRTNPQAHAVISLLHSWGLYGKSIVQLGLGFHDGSFTDLIRHMNQEKGYTMAQLEEARLVSKSPKGSLCDRMRDCLVIPVINANGEIVAFDSLTKTTHQLYKHPNTPRFSRRNEVYSLNLAKKTCLASVIVATSYESYFRLYGAGLNNTVAVLSRTVTEEQMILLKAHFKVVMLVSDRNVDPTSIRAFCQKNDMYFEDLSLTAWDDVAVSVGELVPLLKEKAEKYQGIFRGYDLKKQ